MRVGDTIKLDYHSIDIGEGIVDVRNKLDNIIAKYNTNFSNTVDKAILTSMSNKDLMKMYYMILDELRERRI